MVISKKNRKLYEQNKSIESLRREVERLNNIAGEANSKLGKLLEQYRWLFDTTYNYKLYEVRINRIMMNGKKRKSFSWIRGGCSQVDQGSGL